MELELPPEARALLDAVVAIGSDLDLRGVLTRIVESACRLTAAEYGVLAIVDDQGRYVDLVATGPVLARFDAIGRMPEGHGLLGMVPRDKQTVRVEHVGEFPEFTGSFPNHHPDIDSFLGSPVLVGSVAFGHLYLGNKSEDRAFTATDQALVEALARAAGVMIENARTYEQAEWRRRWVAGTSQIGSDLSGTAQVQQAVEELLFSLRELCDARLVAFVRVDGEALEVRQVAGEDDAVGAVLAERAAVVREVAAGGESDRIVDGPGRVTLVVPVATRLAAGGVVLVEQATETPSLQAVMLDLVGVTAVQLGLVLDREQALRDRAERLVARDRDRIARDLHDLVIQRLFATGMQLQAARNLGVDDLRPRIDGAVADLDAAIAELRSTIFELNRGGARPLLDEVRSLLGEYAEVLGFQPVLRVSGQVDTALDADGCTQLLSTLREVLSNVARHAGAGSVVVALSAGSTWFRLRVVDDGRGFDPAQVREGSGTPNLRARAAGLGGHLTLTSAPGEGTSIEWVVPIVG